jgi:hypothetical protein
VDQASWGNVIAIVFLIVIASIVIVVIWQHHATRQATAAVLRDDEYKKLAERATTAHEQIVQELGAANAELSDLRGRVAEIERMMKEVE